MGWSPVLISAGEAVLHVATCGSGPDLVVLSGGPGCVNYLAEEALAPTGFRCWFPDPRGVAGSEVGPHDMHRAIDDLEAIRVTLDISEWIVLGHSWGGDLAVRYALDHPNRVHGVVSVCGHGLHDDRSWFADYYNGRALERHFEIECVRVVHDALRASFTQDWIRTSTLWRHLADSRVTMSFLVAGDDIGTAACCGDRLG